MRRNGKIIKMNPGFVECGYSMFLIHQKTNSCQNPDNENENTKNQSQMRTAVLRAIRN